MSRKPLFSWKVAGVWFEVSATIERIDRQLVGHLAQVREEVGDPQAALAPSAERPVGPAEPADLAEEDVGLRRTSLSDWPCAATRPGL